jgi:hypothetical protein
MPNAANLNRSPTTESARSHPAIAVARTVQDWETVSFNRPASARGKAPGGGGPGPRKPGSAATSSGIAAAKLEGETEELKRECDGFKQPACFAQAQDAHALLSRPNHQRIVAGCAPAHLLAHKTLGSPGVATTRAPFLLAHTHPTPR